ncbi:DNA topology modulation protein [Paenibacillus sp. GYB003]|uniref:DNA topology modulation protein n=1 Tax=Paenibacillus sp. GYB003 TaxID=2994392 RepID=UPI002F960D3D
MKRVVILGCSGSGKSTMARRIAERTGLPVYHLDAYYWKPGWVAADPETFDAEVAEIAAEDRWIIDGNYSRTLDLRLSRSDTVIFFDYPRYLCLYRVLKRRLQYRGRSRADMGEGCEEKIDLAFLKWIWNFRKRSRPKLLDKLRRVQPLQDVYRFRTPREADDYLKRLAPKP